MSFHSIVRHFKGVRVPTRDPKFTVASLVDTGMCGQDSFIVVLPRKQSTQNLLSAPSGLTVATASALPCQLQTWLLDARPRHPGGPGHPWSHPGTPALSTPAPFPLILYSLNTLQTLLPWRPNLLLHMGSRRSFLHAFCL